MRLLVKGGTNESTSKNILIKIHTYPILPTNECLSPIYELRQCQADIYSG